MRVVWVLAVVVGCLLDFGLIVSFVFLVTCCLFVVFVSVLCIACCACWALRFGVRLREVGCCRLDTAVQGTWYFTFVVCLLAGLCLVMHVACSGW